MLTFYVATLAGYIRLILDYALLSTFMVTETVACFLESPIDLDTERKKIYD